MKKNLRKFISFMLSFVIMLTVIMAAPITVNASSNMTLSQLKTKFPAGKYWNHAGSTTNNPDGYTSTPCYHHGGCDYYGSCGCNSFGASIQCFGFANKLAYDMFGSYYTSWSKTTLSNLKPGDVIRYKNDGHSIFVTGVDGDTITYGDCNSDGHCIIRWNATISKSTVASTLTAVYSAPSCLSVDDTPVDLGTDFYAYIINTAAWKPLINDGLHNANFNDSADEIKKIWKFRRNDNGTYTILSYYDNNALDVDLGKSENGTNVGVWTEAGTSNQQWFIYGSSAQYYFKSACSEAVLDMAGGKYNEGVNAQIWENNGTDAQLFQIWTLDSNSVPQNVGTDFYAYIINTAAWKPLVNDGQHNANFNDSADEIEKIWRFVRNDNGSYTIISYYDNNALDVDLGKTENGTDVGVWTNAGTSNQQWFIYGSSARYYFKPACASAVLDMTGGDYYEGVNAQIWENNGTDAQLFQIWALETNSVPRNIGSDFYAYIINTAADKPLVNDGFHKAYFSDSIADIHKLWRFVRNDNGSYKIISAYDNNVLDVDLGQSENGTDVGVWTDSETSNQQWFVYGASTKCHLKPVCSSAVLDMAGGEYYEGANAQIWANNGTDAQLFQILTIGNSEAERIINSSKMLPGDTNSDGKVNLLDAISAQSAALDLLTLDEQGTANADMNGDGKITMFDAIAIQRLVLSL